jgi:peptidoglycan hydrolase CwlO-like protein
MTFKSAMSTIGTGILATGTVLNNAPIQNEISEIDEEIKQLQERRARLESKLI